MTRWILIICLLSWLPRNVQSQDQKGHLIAGSYFSLLIDPVVLSTTQDSATITQFFLNTNLRYAFNKKFMVGTEFLLCFASPDEVNDPFYLVGVSVDYNFLRAERSKINFRLGLSYGNLSYAGENEVQRRMVINRVIGGSYDFKITKSIWLYAGIYNHLPFNDIPFKYATAQPFLGAYFELK